MNIRLSMTLTCALILSGPAHAASTVLFNTSPAYECYRQTLTDTTRPDIEPCTMAIELQGLDVEALAATYSNRGILLARMGDLREALSDHNRAVEFGTGKSHLFINRANALVRVKRFSEAMRDLDRAVEIADEALAAAHYNRSLLFHRLGDLPSARVEAEKASQLSPESMAYRQFFESLSGIEGLNDEAL